MRLSDLKSEAVVAEGVGAEAPAPVDKDAPTGVIDTVTPTGIGVYFQEGPKRLYKILVGNEGSPDDWVQVPSPSGIVDCLEKGGLSWWGMKVGIAGALKVLEDGDLGGPWPGIDADIVVEVASRLTAEKLTVNHVRDSAATRGTNVHTALEAWAESGVMPDPKFFPENEQGYVRGLIAFLNDCQPEVHYSELIVASKEHMFAGRFDTVATLNGTQRVNKVFPKNPSQVVPMEPGMKWLLDLKTSKGVFPSYHLQTAGYELGFEESYGETVDQTGVVRVTADGKYELVKVLALPSDFLAVKDVSEIVNRIEQEGKTNR